MNQSKLLIRVAYIMPLMMLLALLSFLPSSDGANLMYDARFHYAPMIENEIVSNWHSSLFLYEGIIIKKLYALVEISANGWLVIRTMALVFTAMMLASVSYIVLQLCHRVCSYIIVYIAICSIVIFNGGFKDWGLDQFFTMACFPVIGALIALYKSKSSKKKIFLLIFISLLLWHCCAYRKNAVLLLPVVLTSIALSFESVRRFSFFKKLTLIGSSSLICAIFFVSIIDILLPVIKTNPTHPMMMSDMRIATILEGGQENHKLASLAKETDISNDIITAYCIGLKDVNLFEELNELYFQYWTENTSLMIDSKVIQVSQFYNGGIIPRVVRRYIEWKYPHVRDNANSWKNVYIPDQREIRMLTLLLLFVSVVVSYCRVKKVSLKNATFDYTYIFIAFSALTYAASFLIVTPTPNYRYLIPSMCLGQLALSMWIGRLIIAGYKKYYDCSS